MGKGRRGREARGVAAGIKPWSRVLDPGLGFAKEHSDSAALLGGLAAMRRDALRGVWGRLPLLVGPSRKRFIGELTGARCAFLDGCCSTHVWGCMHALPLHSV